MSQLTRLLNDQGIGSFPGLYTDEEIGAINQLVDPILLSRVGERRAYVHPEELFETGAFDRIMSAGLWNAIFSIMPDPVIYHCHVYEIAANDTRSHIFSDNLLGWHRDPDCDYAKAEPTHVSIFVYLSKVGPEDGAFEFVPGVPPTKWLHNGAPYISAQGPPGMAFAWQRSYYHRASPNRGPVRRRLFKLSIQRNAFRSAHLGNPHFQQVMKTVQPGDARLDLMLGRYQGKTAPQFPPASEPRVEPVVTNNTLHLSSVELTKAQLRERAITLKRMLRGNKEQMTAAYD
jgi:hypothetical protein